MPNKEPHGHSVMWEHRNTKCPKGYSPGWEKRPLSDSGKKMLYNMKKRAAKEGLRWR